MLATERDAQLPVSFLSKQKEVSYNMRTILINWISQMHRDMKLRRETLYIAVSLIDRTLERMKVRRRDFHLVGIASLWIAIKYEEVKLPKIRTFLDVTKSGYCRREVIAMEMKILVELEFQVTVPSSNFFLTYLCERYNIGEKVSSLARCLTEIALLEGRMVAQYRPSKIAAAALKLSIKLIGEP